MIRYDPVRPLPVNEPHCAWRLEVIFTNLAATLNWRRSQFSPPGRLATLAACLRAGQEAHRRNGDINPDSRTSYRVVNAVTGQIVMLS